MCEEYHYSKDFKLKLIGSYFRDHLVRHLADYEKCYNTEAFQHLPSAAEKDRAFLDCHNRWNRNLKEQVSLELDVKARSLFL